MMSPIAKLLRQPPSPPSNELLDEILGADPKREADTAAPAAPLPPDLEWLVETEHRERE